jgi:hypothetical protein
VVSVMDSYSRILGFSRPEPLIFLPGSSLFVLTRLSGYRSRPTTVSDNLAAPGIETGTFESVARNSDH